MNIIPFTRATKIIFCTSILSVLHLYLFHLLFLSVAKFWAQIYILLFYYGRNELEHRITKRKVVCKRGCARYCSFTNCETFYTRMINLVMAFSNYLCLPYITAIGTPRSSCSVLETSMAIFNLLLLYYPTPLSHIRSFCKPSTWAE